MYRAHGNMSFTISARPGWDHVPCFGCHELLDSLFLPTFCSGNLCWLASLLRDVTGDALFSSAVAWFCVEIESVITLLVLRCYGFYEVLNLPRWFVSADVTARVQRTGFQVVRARVGVR